MPQKLAGILTDPPMSVPIPTGEQLAATRAASPPEEPPADLSRLWGLRVQPKKLLIVSGIMSNWGILVFTKGIAPF